MSRYIALIDGKAGAYGVVFPDLPGCTAMGRTMDAALSNAAGALRDWADLMDEEGLKIPRARNLSALRKDADFLKALSESAGLARTVLIKVA
ncbi:MAG TPA: type II toxin-antitoxin system HicB family antitoxin [Rhizomicrobium sp.]|jgi:predicted RNase H-like HicB family nuclease|nr:type II toxin-antitoxin system HicB family antitoxin [Rhizomicrobium sp.]